MNREHIQEAADYIRQHISEVPDLAIILGSGLGEYADSFAESQIIPYADIPHCPTSTVPGHKGRFVFGGNSQTSVVAMQGRFHFYEGYSLEQVTFPIRVLGILGVRRLIVTNAAGGINPQFVGGDLMLIHDHINLMGTNPLRGLHHESFGQRFPDMTEAYNREDGVVFRTVAKQLGIALKQGVYVGLSGPSYETPAEIRMLRTLGADAVGMSTVPEVIVANQMGMLVSGISCITNMAAGLNSAKLTHEEVMETAERVRQSFIALLDGAIQQFRGEKKISSQEDASLREDIPLEQENVWEASRTPLIRAATEARLRAYAPYSHFHVGAAVMTRSGKIFPGCNVENSSYGATVCAEQTALLQAYAHGERDITAIAIVTATSPPTPPCGICRQVILELAADVEIILANFSGEIRYLKIDELLPEAFHKGFLS